MLFGKWFSRLALTLALARSAASGMAADWTSWRGPNRDGIAPEKGLQKVWDEKGPPLVWKADGFGKGYSSLSISKGIMVTMGEREGAAFVIGIDQSNGKELWATKIGKGEPNCTPTIDGELVYSLGRDGDLACCNIKTGELVWSKNYKKDFGGSMMSGWGYSESPLIDGDRLICTPGSNDAMIAALNKKTGDVIWTSKMPDLGSRGNPGAAYSSIVISNAGGVKQYVQLIGKGIISVAAKDGKYLWNYNRIANGTANIPTPIVKDNFVFCSTGYGTGAALLEIKKAGEEFKVEEKYFLNADQMQNHHGGMVLFGDYIYCGHGHNNGFPLCIEMKTGKVVWGGKQRGAGGGSAAVLLADGNLYFRYEDGKMGLVEATPAEYRLKGAFELASKNGKSWPHPVIVDGLMYIRDHNTLLCYDVRAK